MRQVVFSADIGSFVKTRSHFAFPSHLSEAFSVRVKVNLSTLSTSLILDKLDIFTCAWPYLCCQVFHKPCHRHRALVHALPLVPPPKAVQVTQPHVTDLYETMWSVKFFVLINTQVPARTASSKVHGISKSQKVSLVYFSIKTRMLCVGVDVGGTNTDAVVMQGTAILGRAKTLSTEDPSQGILDAVQRSLDGASCGVWVIPLFRVGHPCRTMSSVPKRSSRTMCFNIFCFRFLCSVYEHRTLR